MLDLGPVLDRTPISGAPFFQEYRDTTPLGVISTLVSQQTDMIGYKPLAIQRVAVRTETGFELRQVEPFFDGDSSDFAVVTPPLGKHRTSPTYCERIE